MSQVRISIAKDFSKFPAGRHRKDGRYSGEAFRNDLLVPAVSVAESVVVELDGTAGYGSSFLEEVFGGLVRVADFGQELLKSKLKLETKDRMLAEEIWGYISDASQRNLSLDQRRK